MRRQQIKIELDPEQRSFIEARLPNTSYAALERQCLEQFGRPRAAGHSAIHRYDQCTRGARAEGRGLSLLEQWRRRHGRGNPSAVLLNPGMRAFIRRNAPRLSYRAIAELLRQRWPDQPVSANAVGRYWRAYAESKGLPERKRQPARRLGTGSGRRRGRSGGLGNYRLRPRRPADTEELATEIQALAERIASGGADDHPSLTHGLALLGRARLLELAAIEKLLTEVAGQREQTWAQPTTF
jgi:hypothetical protein